MIKTLNKLEIERTFLNIIQAIHENHTATENLSPKIRNKADACFANSI